MYVHKVKFSIFRSGASLCNVARWVTLTASGFSGQLEWYLNDVLITNTADDKTKYTAPTAFN
jgi:hypothetical protein